MPGLDYKNAVGAGTRVFASRRFYDGTTGRELTSCPRCGGDADAMFGDHGGDCPPQQMSGRDQRVPAEGER